MLNKKEFELMRKEVEVFDKRREEIIKISRDVLKLSKGSIYSVHRNDLKTAEKQLSSAKNTINQMKETIKKDHHLANVGTYTEALEEFTEASCYYSFVKKGSIPSPNELGIDIDIYLPGMCDLVGELVRKAINNSIKGDYKSAIKIKEFIASIYEELMLFDFRNIPVRKKFDAIKYGLEKLEDLILELKIRKKI